MVTGLLGDAAMSTSGDRPDNALFLNDPPETVERKVRNAFTGGRATVEEQRRLGATPEVCAIWALWRTRFAESEDKFQEVTAGCRSGALLCGECKGQLLERVHKFYRYHNEARERVKSWAESTIVTAAPKPV